MIRPVFVSPGLQIARLFHFAIVMLPLIAAGCVSFTLPEERPKPTPGLPVWDVQEITEHLRFLNGSEAAGRATGTQGYAWAAAYGAARMQEFRLQPAIGDEFRTIFGSPLNYPVDATLRAVGTDSLLFLPGIHFLPDGRSDTGSIQVQEIILSPNPDSLFIGVDEHGLPAAAALTEQEATTELLTILRDAGLRNVVIVGHLAPVPAPEPVEDLLVMQVTLQTAGLLFGSTEDRLLSLLQSRRTTTIRLPRVVVQSVTTDYRTLAGAINTMGYVVGKHPIHSKELVIVCTDMDAVGQLIGIRTIDFKHFGGGTAALLEVARHYGHVTRHWVLPDRSIMFAIWSGARIGHTGLRTYLEHPTWALDRTAAIIYIGLDREEMPAVRELLEPYDVTVFFVSDSLEPLHQFDAVLLPNVVPNRVLAELNLPTWERPDINLSAIIDTAAANARQMAEEAHMLVQRLSTIRSEDTMMVR